MQLEFMLIEIVSDVGIREDTVHESLKILRVRNNEFPAANRYTDDELAQKLLKMIMNASSYLSLKAQTELDATHTMTAAFFFVSTPNIFTPLPFRLRGKA